MKKALFLIIILANVIVLSVFNKAGAKGKTVRFVVSARKHTLDQYKRGTFAFARLKKRVRYKVTISGNAYFGKNKAKGIFVHFVNNKEDSNAERFLFVKPGDYFYIHTGGSRPFIMAFFMKFYSNRATYKGRLIVTCTPEGKWLSDYKYKEEDMYKGIK